MEIPRMCKICTLFDFVGADKRVQQKAANAGGRKELVYHGKGQDKETR